MENNNIKIIYVVAGTDEKAIKIVEEKFKNLKNIKIVCVEKIEDVPFNCDTPNIQHVNKLTPLPDFQLPKIYNTVEVKKGHERPYKFHR